MKKEKPIRLREITEERGTNSKVFHMSDGSRQAVYYPGCMHVYNEEKSCYESVDNSLHEEGDYLVSGRTAYRARFDKSEESSEIFSISDGAHEVTVHKSCRGRKGRHAFDRVKRERIPFTKEINEKTDTVVYSDTDTDADYVYSLTGSGVKEDIVIKSRRNTYLYEFLLHMKGVACELLEEENRVVFRDTETGDEVFNIPAPFMTDADGVTSTAVTYGIRDISSDRNQSEDSEDKDTIMAVLTVSADSSFINAPERAFPVTIDPQIRLAGTDALTTYSWEAGNIYNSTLHTVGTIGNGDGSCNANRMYISLNRSSVSGNLRIIKAELTLTQQTGSYTSTASPKIGIYRVNEDICIGTCTPMDSSNLIDYNVIKTGTFGVGEPIVYDFDITDVYDAMLRGEYSKANLVVKMFDETNMCNDKAVFFGSSYGSYSPVITVTYEDSYALNSSHRTHTHSLGRFGQGSIDLATGNFMFESEDLVWQGNRMPVSIKHLYNSALYAYKYTKNSSKKLNTADFSAMNIGCGYKLNLMQSMTECSFADEGMLYQGYAFTDENGAVTYFKESTKTEKCADKTQCYNLYEDVNNSENLYDPVKRTIKMGGMTYRFNTNERLDRITDEHGNYMSINYVSGRISYVVDGAGRSFVFAYSTDGYLTSITAPDGTAVSYAYDGSFLSEVTYPDGRKAKLTYTSGRPQSVVLTDKDGNDVYKAAYTFSGGRVTEVSEYGIKNNAWVQGAITTYNYSAASKRTIAMTTEKRDGEETENCINTVYTFDEDGNVISEYAYSSDIDKTGVSEGGSGINPYAGEGGMQVVSNINNLIKCHSFENSDSRWINLPSECSGFTTVPYYDEKRAKYGRITNWLRNFGECMGENGIYQLTNVLPKGQYTFSAYVSVDSEIFCDTRPGIFLRVTDTSDNVIAESERISKRSDDYIRLILPFELTSPQSVKVQIVINGMGSVDVDGAQLENNPYANAYNMLENGNFENGLDSSWINATYGGISTSQYFNMSKSVYMTGNIYAKRYVSQAVNIKKAQSTRETFTLSGWAKGYGLTVGEHEGKTTPEFRLRAVIKYADGELEEHVADFSPCTSEWQLASVTFAKEMYKSVDNLEVYCDYNYNTGTAYFDDIQLIRTGIETDLSEEDFTGVYEDADEAASDGAPEEQEERTTVSEDEGYAFEEAKDRYGNVLTETTFTDGEFGTIYRSFGYNEDSGELTGNDAGNNLVRETDVRGNETSYDVDPVASRNEVITDRCGNKTAYEYNENGNISKITSIKADENEESTDDDEVLSEVSYSYDAFDNMTEIARGDGLAYVLAYNEFHNLESIGVKNTNSNNNNVKELISYTYKEGNGRLKKISYANGDYMQASYNKTGQLVSEKWYDGNDNLKAHYKYVYDGQGNIVRSIDIFSKKEYNYTYEDGRIIRATESTIVLNSLEMVTRKTLVNSIFYSYDKDGRQTRKRVIPALGSARVTEYEYPGGSAQVSRFSVGERMITSHSKTDSFGRKVFDELQLGGGVLSRQYSYHTGEYTTEHQAKY